MKALFWAKVALKLIATATLLGFMVGVGVVAVAEQHYSYIWLDVPLGLLLVDAWTPWRKPPD